MKYIVATFFPIVVLMLIMAYGVKVLVPGLIFFGACALIFGVGYLHTNGPQIRERLDGR